MAPSSSLVKTAGCLLRALPKWPYIDDFTQKGRGARTLDNHQLIAMDMLLKPWLEDIFGDRFPRTRLLISDEGGIGKTLSCVLHIKHILDSGGVDDDHPIVIIRPASDDIKWQWKDELRVALSEAQMDRINTIPSRLYRNDCPGRDIHIISKHSLKGLCKNHGGADSMLNFLLKNREGESFTPSLVIIDEIHEGRSGDDEENRTLLRESAKAICRDAKSVIGLSATPVNIESDEVTRMFRMMGGEGIEIAKQISELPDGDFENWIDISQALHSASLMVSDGKIPTSVLIDAIRTGLNSESYPLPSGDREILVENFSSLNWSLDEWKNKGPRLLRELHPLGRIMTLTRRADLGREECEKKYRDLTLQNRVLEWDDELKDWFMNNRQWDENRGDYKSRIVSWPWRSNHGCGETIPPPDIRLVHSDPRFKELTRLIEADSKISTRPIGKRRGAIVFCQWIPTVEGLHAALKDWASGKEVSYTVRMVTGEDKSGLSIAKSQSRNVSCYPIVICTQVGEVGINMEWATLGCHWDFGHNPMSVEQRSWRLDRRIKDSSTCRAFRIVRLHTDHPFHAHIREKFDNRLEKAEQILGLPRESMVRYQDPRDEIERQWDESKSLFYPTSYEVDTIRNHIGTNASEKVNSYAINVGIKSEKIMWKLMGDVETLPIDVDCLVEEDKVRIGNDELDELLETPSELVQRIRTDLVPKLPGSERRLLMRLLSAPVTPSDDENWDDYEDVFQPLAIKNSDSDISTACRSTLKANSDLFRIIISEQWSSVEDPNEHRFTAIDMSGMSSNKLLLCNVNPPVERVENYAPSWFEGSLWLSSGNGVHQLDIKNEDDAQVLDDIMSELYDYIVSEHNPSLIVSHEFESQEMEQIKTAILANLEGKNGKWDRRIRRHLDPERKSPEGWPDFDVQLIAEV